LTKPQALNLSSLIDTFDILSYDKQHGDSKASTKKSPNTNTMIGQQKEATWTPCSCAKHLAIITRMNSR